MLAIRLDPALEERLAALAAKTGRTKTFYARAAIEEYIEDMEDYFLAEERMRDFKPGDGTPLEQVKAELGLGD
ncbi:MAG TPA: TraY domain-containing protein [Sphingomonadaceae bacterium]|nr:TraY domain-containing protein [Sphingomonadaceae bacterium]